MEVLESINQYTRSIQSDKCMYNRQKVVIDIVKTYINNTIPDIKVEDFDMGIIDKLLLYWIPKNKKYVTESQIYQIISTIVDIYTHIFNQKITNTECPSILDLYGEEYKRAYKAKNMLLSMTLDPVISIDPLIIGLDRYRNKRNKQGVSERSTTYVQALFEVLECKEGGLVVLGKMGSQKTYKLLLEYPTYKYLKVGDIIHAIIRRKLFYVYWEFEELRGYYLKQAMKFLSYDV